MDDSNDFLIDKLMEFITEENIDEKLLFYSAILQRLMDKKECMDINISSLKTKDFKVGSELYSERSSVKHRACNKKLKLEFLELVSDEDSSSDYLPSEIDSINADSDDE